jgi:hypothetical protein
MVDHLPQASGCPIAAHNQLDHHPMAMQGTNMVRWHRRMHVIAGSSTRTSGVKHLWVSPGGHTTNTCLTIQHPYPSKHLRAGCSCLNPQESGSSSWQESPECSNVAVQAFAWHGPVNTSDPLAGSRWSALPAALGHWHSAQGALHKKQSIDDFQSSVLALLIASESK